MVPLPFLGGQGGDLGHRDRGAARMEEQVVLGEEPGEEHPVPLLVRDLLDEAVDPERQDAAAERAAAGTEGGAQVAV